MVDLHCDRRFSGSSILIQNSHRWGDEWNGEDLSLYSKGSTSERSKNQPRTRADVAYIRPAPLIVFGSLISHAFSLSEVLFDLRVDGTKRKGKEASEATIVFVPTLHFPRDAMRIETSDSSHWELEQGSQLIHWWHGSGKQWLQIRGVHSQKATSHPSSCSCM